MQTKISKISKNFLINCSPLLYISTPSLLSLSLFRAAVGGGGGGGALSLSREERFIFER
jgi:hypothetical protein